MNITRLPINKVTCTNNIRLPYRTINKKNKDQQLQSNIFRRSVMLMNFNNLPSRHG